MDSLRVAVVGLGSRGAGKQGIRPHRHVEHVLLLLIFLGFRVEKLEV